MSNATTPKVRRRLAPDERREAILDAANALFMRQGYDAVTIADVLDAAGISKGGFYHHFTAKEDLLTGIVARMTEQALAVAKAARDRACGDALDRLNAFLDSSVRWKAENSAETRVVAKVMLQPGNDTLFQRILAATAATVVPVLRDMIADGVREGVFDVADPQVTAEIIIGLSQGRQGILAEAIASAAAGEMDAATDRLDARMRAEGEACDRLLGLPPGSVRLSNRPEYRRMLAGLAAADGATDDPAGTKET
ncbi:TetR/AcrR family transcriptional regulator [Maliponia aquimaris]|uniref:Putative HTH-type transcriptional regulator YfiR n=1 Tax=Maliponia aquimaris TaxID=1673631 RepID=A0A238K714_9RHOB|nr:TetR/AcrR family transcriptional regulator [Maliponia aquimaris]SMX38605.1 putative HTH-type transcriptional regulator YfiR [Maliponia aquimaris]